MAVAAEKAAAVEQYHLDTNEEADKTGLDEGVGNEAIETFEAASEALQTVVVVQEEGNGQSSEMADIESLIDQTEVVDDVYAGAYR